MTKADLLRSRVTGNCQARFWNRGGVSDDPIDCNGYHGGDVEIVETCSRRGVRVVATLHGHVLMDVLQNPTFWPLLGHVRLSESRRLTEPVFKAAVEVRGHGKLLLHQDLMVAVDKLLVGEDPGGLQLGSGWED